MTSHGRGNGRLPLELFEPIFEHVDQIANSSNSLLPLLNLCLVSSSLLPLAQRILYRHLVIVMEDSDHIGHPHDSTGADIDHEPPLANFEPTNPTLQSHNLVRTLIKFPHLAKLVRTVEFRYFNAISYALTPAKLEMERIVTVCGNVTQILLDDGSGVDESEILMETLQKIKRLRTLSLPGLGPRALELLRHAVHLNRLIFAHEDLSSFRKGDFLSIDSEPPEFKLQILAMPLKASILHFHFLTAGSFSSLRWLQLSSLTLAELDLSGFHSLQNLSIHIAGSTGPSDPWHIHSLVRQPPPSLSLLAIQDRRTYGSPAPASIYSDLPSSLKILHLEVAIEPSLLAIALQQTNYLPNLQRLHFRMTRFDPQGTKQTLSQCQQRKIHLDTKPWTIID